MVSVRYKTELEEGTSGFHRTLRTRLWVSEEEEYWENKMAAGCGEVGLLYQFPETVIVDQDEVQMRHAEGRLSEPPFLSRPSLPSDRLYVWAHRDIEAPAISRLPTIPSREAVLFRPLLPSWQNLSLLLPFHLRYLPPIQTPTDSPQTLLQINPPMLIKLCNHSTSSSKFTPQLNPNTLRLITQSLPVPPGQSLHLLPTTNQLPLLLSIPVGIQQDELWVQLISTAAVCIVFVWICSCLIPRHPLPHKKIH